MIRFVVFVGRTQYSRNVFSDLFTDKEVLLEKVLPNKVLETINILHTSCRTNKYLRIPGQSVWYKLYLDYNKIPKDSRVITLLCEENRLCYDKNYIKYLKKRYPKMLVGFYAVNWSGVIKKPYLRIIEDWYDFVVTFDKRDSEKYGWIYYSGVYSDIRSKVKREKEARYDVFYAGSNSGRLEQLHEIYDYLTRNGVRCKFFISDVPENKQKKGSNIIYNKRLSYDDILKYDGMANCILELLRGGQNGVTLRLAESLMLSKKLITNNKEIINERYYKKDNMMIFEKAEDIDLMFVKENHTKEDYDGSLSPKHLLNYLSNLL